MPFKPVADRLQKALCYENGDYFKEHGLFVADCEEIVPFWCNIKGKEEYPDKAPEIYFGRHTASRCLKIDEAVAGMMEGRPQWQHPYWVWLD